MAANRRNWCGGRLPHSEGMEKFVPKGARVVVKPNICVDYHSYEYAATTNPWVVGTLVKMCFEASGSQRESDGRPIWRHPDARI